MKKRIAYFMFYLIGIMSFGNVVQADSTKHLVAEIYVATFGRAPSDSGMNYWADSVDSGQFSIDMVAQSFFDQPETQTKFPEGSSNSEFITTIYYNVLNRAPKTAGLNYWLDALDRGLMRRDQAIMAIINGAKAETGSAEDAALLAKKTTIGVLFAESEIGTSHTDNGNFMSWAREIINLTNSDDFGLEEAEEYNTRLLRSLSSSGTCGAYVAPGVWKEFDCYNLAAIGKTTNDDPFTPSWRLIGGYWKWGRKGPDSSQWHDSNTSNFAHGPTGPSAAFANGDEVDGWGTYSTDGTWTADYASDGAWSDSEKTANDPCPNGYRVPSESQWQGVIDNNQHSSVGTWSTLYDDTPTNYSSASFLGDDLMLPAAGFRCAIGRMSSDWFGANGGWLVARGYVGSYWSSTLNSSGKANNLAFSSSHVGIGWDERNEGVSVRCIAE